MEEIKYDSVSESDSSVQYSDDEEETNENNFTVTELTNGNSNENSEQSTSESHAESQLLDNSHISNNLETQKDHEECSV